MAKYNQRPRGSQRAITRGKIRKLQKAGLISAKVNPNRKPSASVINALYKYRGVLSGRQAAVKLSDGKSAAELRSRVGDGGRGKVVIVPREKGERFRVVGNKIKSTRKQYGQTIEKTIGVKFTAPGPGERVYYTIPRRKRGGRYLKRQTFSSFDEMLYYLSKYEIEFEDIERYIETEKVGVGTRKQRQFTSEITKERKRYERKAKRGR